jgi:hypothetical protein
VTFKAKELIASLLAAHLISFIGIKSSEIIMTHITDSSFRFITVAFRTGEYCNINSG